jgi:hypothetical protein
MYAGGTAGNDPRTILIAQTQALVRLPDHFLPGRPADAGVLPVDAGTQMAVAACQNPGWQPKSSAMID